jgi:rRNA maturation protein Nop10
MAGTTETLGEKCQRCGEHGEDRRTLWMSCLYSMEELGIPFEQSKVMGKAYPKVGEEELALFGRTEDPRYPKIMAPKYASEPSAEVERGFYTLRVCKSCRSDWMQAIKFWFNTVPKPEASCGSGIYVRELGKVVEITYEEWQRRKFERGEE